MINVIEMIRKELVDMGAEGLVNDDYECGCDLDDLAPCGNIHETKCVAARKKEQPSMDFWMERIE